MNFKFEVLVVNIWIVFVVFIIVSIILFVLLFSGFSVRVKGMNFLVVLIDWRSLNGFLFVVELWVYILKVVFVVLVVNIFFVGVLVGVIFKVVM